MKVLYCDCCKRKIRDCEQVYSIGIKHGTDKEFILDDVCDECYGKFRDIIENAENGDKIGNKCLILRKN